jgi:tRNA (guanine37-N1)-methyltransferase
MGITMNFHVLTLFPEMIQQGLGTSITGRAIDKGLISVNTVNIRDFSLDKHSRVDDYPYGGGAGMVIQAEPVFKAYGYLANHIKMSKENAEDYHKPRVIYVTPQGSIFNQGMARELAQEEDLIFLCGHYEGIDERVLEMIVTDHISIGDYVLTGGELPAMVMIDAISRLVPGVLNNEVSSEFESLQDNLLEYPQYTRPEIFMGKRVPEVLLTGHHANIEAWRREQSILRTIERRPDLLENAELTENEREYLTRLIFQKNFDIY